MIKREIKTINTDGLDLDTKKILSKKCYFIGHYYENDTLFCEVENVDGGLVRIFPERIELYDDDLIPNAIGLY